MEDSDNSDENYHVRKKVMSNKFVISIKKISLDISEKISCKFRLDCSLFPTQSSIKLDGTCCPFQLNPDQAQDYTIDTEGYKEYINEMDQSELDKNLHSHPLKIAVYNDELLLGTCNVNLNVIFGSNAEQMNYGLRCIQEGHILDKNDTMIGSIKFLIALEQEECNQCQGCNEFFQSKLIITHVIRNPDCKSAYSKEDMDVLKNNASARKKRLRNRRDRRNYDPKKRSQLHAKYYNPVKNTEKRTKKSLEEKRNAKNLTLIAIKKRREGEVRKMNLDEMKNKMTFFKTAKKILCLDNLDLSVDTLDAIESFQDQFKRLQIKLDKKLMKLINS